LEVVHQLTVLDELTETTLKTVASATFGDAVREAHEGVLDVAVD